MKYPKFLRQGGLPVGPPEDFPPGSVPRAKSLTIGLLTAWDLASTTERAWERELERAQRESAHKALGFEDFDSYLNAAIGKTAVRSTEHVKSRAANPKKPNPNGRPKNGSQTTVLGRGAEYWTARIADERPDILERMKAGDFKSVRAAAIAAGIVKVPSALEVAKKAILKLSAAERKALRDWLLSGG
jgi:hypothetical protein